MSLWDNRDVMNSYSRPGKRRFDEINNEIESLKQELMMNDLVLKRDLEMRLSTEYERALVAAELYKDRLLTLTQSSRLQIMFVQMESVLVDNCNQDNDGWNPKRQKFNYYEGTNYNNYSSQYTVPQTSGYCYRNNTNFSRNQATANKRQRKRKAQVNTAVKNITATVKPSTFPAIKTEPAENSNAAVKIATATVKPSPSPATKCKATAKTKAVLNAATATVKQSPSSAKAGVQTFTATTKNNSGNATVTNVCVKTELNNEFDTTKDIPSLLSLRFANSDRTTATVKQSFSPAIKRFVAAKSNSEPAKAGVKTFTATNKNKSGKATVANVPANTELNNEINTTKNIPSLLSLRFANSDGITIKSENIEWELPSTAVVVKTEPNNTGDYMDDDLENHL